MSKSKNCFGRSIELAKLARLILAEAKLNNNKGETKRAVTHLIAAVENILLSHNNAIRASYFPRKGR